MLLGKYNDGGKKVHVGNILGTRGKSPHILDRGGEQVTWINWWRRERRRRTRSNRALGQMLKERERRVDEMLLEVST